VTQEKGFSEDYVFGFFGSRGAGGFMSPTSSFRTSTAFSRFSQNVCGIMERFAFEEQIDARMIGKESRCEVIKAFAGIDRVR
jgi:hypothetical protein